MKQRLGIAIALLNNPKLLILDEPTNGLDPLGIQELRDLIRSFPEKGITVILSSHILAEVEHTADHIGIIHDGELKYQNIIDHNENLEELFMDVVKNGKNEKLYFCRNFETQTQFFVEDIIYCTNYIFTCCVCINAIIF